MRTRPLSLLLLVLVFGAPGPGPERYGLLEESRFWIDGSSTAGSFTCAAREVHGTGQVAPSSPPQVAGRVTVPVRAFDCGNRRMNADFADALRAQAHPSIRFEVRSAEVVGPTDARWTRARAAGTLEIAGVARPLAVEVDGRPLPDGHVRLRGRMPMRMTDFGVRPPTGLLGLVRAHDRIVVRFDLLAAPQ
jgi:polyisoprenoid-binding protein YceI